MAVNKVVYGGETIVDLTADTVTADKMLSGATAHDKSGVKVTGTIATKTASNLSASGATVTVPAGYYASQATKSVSTATQATPSISVSSGGLITAKSTQSAGYVASGTKQATQQLTVQAAQTITPGTSNKTITSGRYLTGTQTIKGDANLVAANIKKGVSIFGVSGSYEGSGSSGGGGSVETCTVNFTLNYGPFQLSNDGIIYVCYTTVDSNGETIIAVDEYEYTAGAKTIQFAINNCVCNQMMVVGGENTDLVPWANGASIDGTAQFLAYSIGAFYTFSSPTVENEVCNIIIEE